MGDWSFGQNTKSGTKYKRCSSLLICDIGNNKQRAGSQCGTERATLLTHPHKGSELMLGNVMLKSFDRG